jgi:hypothetical protein
VAIGLRKLTGAVAAVAAPIAVRLAGNPHLAAPTMLLLVVSACFLTGLLIRTAVGIWIIRLMERLLLERVPGYTLFHSVTRRFAGAGEDPMFAPAMAVFDNAIVPAFVVEKHADGRFTVFVPASPTLAAGAIRILNAVSDSAIRLARVKSLVSAIDNLYY